MFFSGYSFCISLLKWLGSSQKKCENYGLSDKQVGTVLKIVKKCWYFSVRELDYRYWGFEKEKFGWSEKFIKISW